MVTTGALSDWRMVSYFVGVCGWSATQPRSGGGEFALLEIFLELVCLRWLGSPMLFRHIIALVFLVVTLRAAPPELDPAKDLPRIPPVEAADALKTFQLKENFRLELVASEPTVFDPVALAFDENGRMFVVEMTDYSERREEQLGRIRMLEDRDGDGRFEKATVVASGLPWPTGVICYDGGVFVAASPDILYLKDTNGDGAADIRKVVYTGFGSGKDRLNVQALLNSFNWGLDNRIHGATAPNGGVVTNLANPSSKPLDLRGRDFYFDPRTMELFAENGGGQYGFSYDSKGRKFVSSNSRHIMTMMYEARYAERNPFYAMPGALVDIAVDGPAAEVYRISPEEPWRVIRTKWRVSGVSQGIVEGGGRSAGYFTGATGVTMYRGDAFPEDFRDNGFTGDAGGNLVHRKKIYPDGVGVKAMRPADDQKVEFLASRDTWFRPVQFANAPDGTLYVIDMYRETIEHPWSLPEQLKKHLDLNSGNDRGRIYRVVPEDFKQPKKVRLGEASIKELVKALQSPNGWHRDTAARLIYERQDKAAVPLLTAVVEKSKSSLGRMHALYALDGLNALKENTIVKALRDGDETVRQHAVRLSEKFLRASPSSQLWDVLRTLAADPSIQVRYQLAFTLGETKQADRTKVLAEIVKRDGTNSWMRAAALSSLANGAGEMFGMLSSERNFAASKPGREFLAELAEIIGAKNQSNEVARVVEFLGSTENPQLQFPLTRAFAEGLQRAGSSVANLPGDFQAVFKQAGVVASNPKAAETTRLEAIQLLGLASFADAGKTLTSLLDQNQSQAVQLAAVTALGRFSEAAIAPQLIQRFATMTPRVRSEVLTILLARPERVSVLLNAIEQGEFQQSDLSLPQINLLKNHRDAGIKARSAKLFASAGIARRDDVVKAFQPALSMNGNLANGKAIYEERCASCHRFDGLGFALGPDLVTVKNTGKEKLLMNILDPNQEVAPNYKAFEVETSDEESLIGLVTGETATSITLHQAFGKESVILRSQIKKLKSQEQSLMPEGLEAGLKPQDLADLLDYISK